MGRSPWARTWRRLSTGSRSSSGRPPSSSPPARPEPSASRAEPRIELTTPAASWRWIAPDLALRVGPFLAAALAVQLAWRPRWLGVSAGDPAAQLLLAAAGLPLMFVAAAAVQLGLARRRGGLRVPAGGRDIALQAGFYLVNAAAEEAFFRGLLQGGGGALLSPAAGFAAATAVYVLYHRLGGWPWPDVLATALVGVPLGLAFWLMPGPPSLAGVTAAHFGATCGFLGPGPWALRRLRLLG